MKTLHTARVIVMGGRNGRVESTSGCIRLPLSIYNGQSDASSKGTNPERLFGAAFAASFGALLQSIAEQLDIYLSRNFSVTSLVSLQKDDFQKLHLKLRLDCYIPNVTEAQATKLIYSAYDICPYSNALKDNVVITFNWLSDEE